MATVHRNGTNGHTRSRIDFPATRPPVTPEDLEGSFPSMAAQARVAAIDADQAVFDRLAAPFHESEIRTRPGARGPLRYITARTAKKRLNEAVGVANWSNKVTVGDRFVHCSLTIVLPSGREITREALGGIPDMPSEEDRIKGADSDAFKRACVMLGIDVAESDDHTEPAPATRPAPAARPAPAVPATAPRPPVASGRALYAHAKENGLLDLVGKIMARDGLGNRVVDLSPEAVAAIVREIQESEVEPIGYAPPF